MCVVNEISLSRFITYTNSVYDIGKKFKGLSRKNCDADTKASTVAKTLFSSFLCGYKSINALDEINNNKKLDLRMVYTKKEYVSRMHGLRNCIIDTDYHQLETIDGLCVMGWDGVELNETNKDIEGLPEREYDKDNIRKYLKYLVGMNIGERANILVTSKQLLEIEKITTKSGNERAKTYGETKAFQKYGVTQKNLLEG